MRRREWLRFAAAAGLTPPAQPADPSLELRIVRLKLRHTWTTTMASSDFRDTLHVHYSRRGITGVGEGAPISRYGESAASGRQALEPWLDKLRAGDPWQFEILLGEIFSAIPGAFAAKAAVDIALMDWITQRLGVPLYRYYGLDPATAPVTTFSIGIDTPEITKRKVREAAAYPILKIKVGLDSDEATIRAVREVTGKPLRVDANEGWSDKEQAIRKIEWLAGQGVEFVEQPMPAAMLEEARWLRERSPLPIIADEAVTRTADIPALAGTCDGVNVKLDKLGGVREAHRAIQMARALGLKTMLGCMISSSVSVTAAAHLSPLVDYADLDGNLLIANDPYRGVTVKEGRLILPGRPGLGLQPA